jgi:hypothetical protein
MVNTQAWILIFVYCQGHWMILRKCSECRICMNFRVLYCITCSPGTWGHEASGDRVIGLRGLFRSHPQRPLEHNWGKTCPRTVRQSLPFFRIRMFRILNWIIQSCFLDWEFLIFPSSNAGTFKLGSFVSRIRSSQSSAAASSEKHL